MAELGKQISQILLSNNGAALVALIAVTAFSVVGLALWVVLAVVRNGKP